MVNQPDRDMEGLQMPSGRLVLPAPPNEGQYGQAATTPIRPDQPIRHQASPVPHGLIARPKDPLYLVFALALALVIVSIIVFVTFGANTLLNNLNNNQGNSASTQLQTTPSPLATATSNPAPTATPTVQPVVQPTMTPTPTPNNQGLLSIQINHIPPIVNNNTKVAVTVTTSEPGVTVKLQVTYTTLPYLYTSSSHLTGENGKATLSWSVKLITLVGGKYSATVVATATDKKGQQAQSQPVTVIIQVG
jgi:hypothetical protein